MRRLSRRAAGFVKLSFVFFLLLDACARGGPAALAPETPAAKPDAGLAATLGELADRAFADGDLATAENRYGRLLANDPRSRRALTGLGRVAWARGDEAAARARFGEALALHPSAVEARLGMADLAAGDPAEVRLHIERALEVAPTHAGAHARMAALTGRAPHKARSLPEALKLASLHPYDPRALLEAGRRLEGADRSDEAVPVYEAVLGLADLDRDVADAATTRLSEISERWRQRRVVPVYVFLDTALRARPGWRFRQRQLWLEISEELDPLLDTRFVVASFASLDGKPPETVLEARLVALVRRTSREGRNGLFAGFTADATPRRAGASRGIATYLGRHLVVRDAAGEHGDRVLAHEVLHIYGGIHIVDDLDSIMNPTGDSQRVDPLNQSIARSLAPRRFDPGGIDRNVLPYVDVPTVSQAFSRALAVNLSFRQLGLTELVEGARVVGPGAAARVQQITMIDAHLGDVSRFAARLSWASERRVEAVALLEVAAQLYGRQTPDGRAAFARAQVLRKRLKAELGAE